ncbi:uncharacterized protein FTJAE_10032 [Fusarium tjaetaba]|uniref:Uncharacterized protein n=1 Tax=Fusarium tjaetaba TaxID=1567544 RepID=A0A8H5R230_9HYPO|nr:uncharacterized protein FTJAE_10032 [Fusarium tjaetaba]KAF5625314.1 hypothetical protein FTJAE_10032 [Fusarium tjaetaba]
MKFSTIFLIITSVATAMAAALPEPEVEISGKLVSRDEFELAIRQAGCSAWTQAFMDQDHLLAFGYRNL